jgi:hypothetical protein
MLSLEKQTVLNTQGTWDFFSGGLCKKLFIKERNFQFQLFFHTQVNRL